MEALKNAYRVDKRIVCSVICLCFIFQLFSQSQVSFRQLSVNDGLSQNSVVSVTQDSIGYLWLATQDGLNKFDGNAFEVFKELFIDITRPNFSHLGQIYTDREGQIIAIPISKKPQVFNVEANRFLPFTNLEDVSVVFQDTKKNYWFGTYSSGLYKKTKEDITLVLPPENISTVFSITEDPDGSIWITSQGKVTQYQHDTDAFTTYFPDTHSASQINYSQLVFDASGTLWLGTFGHGLFVKSKGSSAFSVVHSLLGEISTLPKDLNILSMHVDKKNRLWIGTYGSGLYKIRINTGELLHYEVKKHNPRSIHYNDILCIYEDYTGTLWFGTDGTGVSFYDEYLEKFNFTNNSQTPEGINIDLVRAIEVDKNDNVWIGTSGKGLSRYTPKTNSWKTYVKTKDGLSSNRIMSLLIEGDELWIGTQDGGLNILQADGNIVQYNKNSSIALPAGTIWSIFKDDAGNIWLSTRDYGLILFDKNKGVIKKIDSHNGLLGNTVRVAIQGGKDSLYIGTEENGIFLLKTKTDKITDVLKEFQISDANLFNKIKSIYYDHNGFLWVGTNGDGLVVFDLTQKTYRNYTVHDGLPNDVIYAILPDSENNLWLSSNRGITMIKPSNNFKEKPSIVNYDNYDGLATEFNTGAYFKADDNNLYFGGLEGFYWFNPADIKKNNVIPKTVLTGFEVYNTPYPLQHETTLNYKQNTVSFTFSSLQFSLPKKNKFAYKLEHYDDGWVDSKFAKNVRYTNLPSGDYQFLVKSSNYDGLWNETPERFSFSILKPWYLSNWMFMVYALFAITLAILTYYYFKWRWKMTLNLKHEKEESERLKRLDEYKTKLYTNLAHEFRSPLTLISAPIKKQLLNDKLNVASKNDLKLVERNTNQLLNLVDQLLELSKLESGNLRLKVKQNDLGLYLKLLTESFQFLAEQHGLKLTASIPDLGNVWFDPDIVEKIVNNLFSNAIKYSAKEGEISFRADVDDDAYCSMTFINAIDGIVEQDISKIFNRFYQVNDRSEGSGIGLSLVKELTTLSHGIIEASYLETSKMKFVVKLPMARDSFSETEIDTTTTLQPKALEIDLQPSENDSKTIVLVVDDNRDIRKFIVTLFDKDYKVIEAKNGYEGIEKAFKIIPDIIISDVMMPVKNGFELCQILKHDERTSHVPILLLTGKNEETDEILGLKTGADDYITKPFNPEALQLKVTNIIDNRNKRHKQYQRDDFFKPKDIAVTSADEVFLKRIQQVLHLHLLNPEFNAETFSNHIAMSRMQLHRKMLAYTGLSTSHFIRSQRLKQAVKILQSSQYTINEVAYMVGFSTPSYFIKCFKETYGKTPSEYQNT